MIHKKYLISFIVLVEVYIIIFFFSYYYHRDKIFVPLDADNHFCGTRGLKDYSKLYFSFVKSSKNINFTSYCVKECPGKK